MVGNHVADLVTRYGESGAVPAELTGYIKDREGYDYSHHGKAGNPSTTFVPDEVVDRFCLLGPPSAQLERLAELRGLGVDQFAIYAMHDAREATIEAYGRSVIPALTLTAGDRAVVIRCGRWGRHDPPLRVLRLVIAVAGVQGCVTQP